jgi:CheY-like chemotaxis protein
MSKCLTVLIVTSDALTRSMCENGLAIAGYDVITATSGASAIEQLEARKVDVLVTDAELRGAVDGLSVARTARDRNPKVEVIYTAAFPQRIPESHKVPRAPCIRAPYSPYQVSGVIGALRQRPPIELLQAA